MEKSNWNILFNLKAFNLNGINLIFLFFIRDII